MNSSSFADWFTYMLDMDEHTFDMFQVYVSRKSSATLSERWKSDFETMYHCATRLDLRMREEETARRPENCSVIHSRDAACLETKRDMKVADDYIDAATDTAAKEEGKVMYAKPLATGTVEEVDLSGRTLLQEKADLDLGNEVVQLQTPCQFPRVHQSFFVRSREALESVKWFCESIGYDLSNQIQKTRGMSNLELKSCAVVLSKPSALFLEQEYMNQSMWERFETMPNDPLSKEWIEKMKSIFITTCKKYLYEIEMQSSVMCKRSLATLLFAFQMKYHKIAKQFTLQAVYRATEKKSLQLCTEDKLLAGLLLFYFLRPDMVTNDICPNVLIKDIPWRDFDDIKGTCLEDLWQELSKRTDLPLFRSSLDSNS